MCSSVFVHVCLNIKPKSTDFDPIWMSFKTNRIRMQPLNNLWMTWAAAATFCYHVYSLLFPLLVLLCCTYIYASIFWSREMEALAARWIVPATMIEQRDFFKIEFYRQIVLLWKKNIFPIVQQWMTCSRAPFKWIWHSYMDVFYFRCCVTT